MADIAQPIAVIASGAKQYVVAQGQTLTVEKLPKGEVEFTDLLSGKKVVAEVGETTKGDKVKILKFRAKTRHLRRGGHRQTLSTLTIKKIG